MGSRWVRALALALGLTATAGCATRPPLEVAPPARAYADTLPIPEPGERTVGEAYDGLEKNVFDPLARLLDLPDHVRRARGRPREAANLNAWDDVENSAWFEHRNDLAPLSLEAVARGPNRGAGPDRSGPWTVVSGSTAGITPKLTIRDARGDRYILKFDPPEHPEMASGAEVISTKLVYAAGYHTPENHIVVFDPERLTVGRQTTITVAGEARAMTADDVERMLQGAARQPDGRVRALASKFLSGKPKGPWNYEGRRRDDPNDRYEHQHRRELRGLFVLAAWLNHEDVRQANTLDMYVGPPEQGYLRHYLIDFGSTLGSGATQPHTAFDGSEYFLDLGQVAARTFTLGLHRASWETADDPPLHPSVGYFSADGFDPASWKPTYPNPAFAERTARDVYWGTKLVASITEEQIRAVVASAEFSDPEAARILTSALIARRHSVLRYGLGVVTPIESPEIVYEPDGTVRLLFRDLAVRHGLVRPGSRTYTARLTHDAIGLRRTARGEPGDGDRAEVRFEPLPRRPPPSTDRRARIATVEVRADALRAARIYLLLDAETGRYRVAGLAH